MSTPSGIPDFRSPSSGLWAIDDPLEVASLWSFYEHPERFYDWVRPLMRKVMAAMPNAAHRVLAEMEQQHALKAIITQNIDSLHQHAGSRRVLEIHGHARSATCLSCGSTWPTAELWPQVLDRSGVLRCPGCDSVLKPDLVLFGEPLPYESLAAAQQESLACDAMVVIGTSLEVMPAADLPLLARRRGAALILITLRPTPLDDQMDVVIHADVVRTLVRLWRTVSTQIRSPGPLPPPGP